MKRESKRKNKKLKIRHIIFLCLSVYLAVVLTDQQLKINEINREIQEVEQDIETLLIEREEMEEEIELLNDEDYMEELAREELGLIKPGETIYRIITDEN